MEELESDSARTPHREIGIVMPFVMNVQLAGKLAHSYPVNRGEPLQ